MLNNIKFVFITMLLLLISHHVAVFAHEYSHAVTAWALGYKNSPLNLNYGDISWQNIFFLFNIDQNVNNEIIYKDGHPYYVAVIAAAGMVMNLLLYVVTYWLLKAKATEAHRYVYLFLVLFALMNIGNIYDYIPIRTFVTQGVMVDILDIEQSLQISPWYVYIFGGYLVAFFIWQFFTKILTHAYGVLNIQSLFSKVSILALCVVVLFGYFGLAGYSHDEPITRFL